MRFDLSEVADYTLILAAMVPEANQQQISRERDRLRLVLDVNNVVVSTLSLRDAEGCRVGRALSKLYRAGFAGGYKCVAL